MQPKIIPVTSLRPRLLNFLNRANRFGEEYIVTKNGKPSAVIVSYEEWESWRETKEILSNPETLRRIRKGRTYFDRGGKGKTIAQVFKEQH